MARNEAGEFVFEEFPHPTWDNGVIRRYHFDNGYTASVISAWSNYDGWIVGSYGGKSGLWEVAVMYNGELCYDTPVTDDVIGNLSDKERDEILTLIEALPPRTK